MFHFLRGIIPYLELVIIETVSFMNFMYKITNTKKFIVIQVIRNGDITSFPNLQNFLEVYNDDKDE